MAGNRWSFHGLQERSATGHACSVHQPHWSDRTVRVHSDDESWSANANCPDLVRGQRHGLTATGMQWRHLLRIWSEAVVFMSIHRTVLGRVVTASIAYDDNDDTFLNWAIGDLICAR